MIHMEEPFTVALHWPLWREILMVVVICSAQLMTQASISQVLVPLTTIGATFGVERDPGELSWTIAAFSLTVGIFVLPSGRLGDIYGHRKLLALGFAVLGLWSGIAGFSAFSRSVIFFDTCRALQGIGPAIMLPNALAILGRNYPTGTRKNLAFGAFAASAPNGFMVGALFASLLTTRLWWPWTFWIQAIASFLFAALVFYAIPPDELSQEEKAISFDWLGTAIALPGLILVNFAFNQAPLVGWSNPYIYILLIIGVLLLIGFFYVEGKVEDPLIPRSIWNLDVSIVLGALACGWASFGIFLFFLVRILEDLRNHTYLSVTAQFAPVCITGVVAGLLCTVLLPRIGPKPTMAVALLAFLTSSILVGTMPVQQSYWAQSFVAIAIAPFGMDLSFPASSIIISDAVPRKNQGLVSSLVNLVVNYSISMGLGFAGTVQAHVARGDLLRGYRGAFYMGIGFASLGLGLCLCGIVTEQLRSTRHHSDSSESEAQEKVNLSESS